MKRSTIGWADFSGGDCNVVTGCSKISPGCEHCYARAIYERFGHNFDEVHFSQDKLLRLSKTNFPPGREQARPPYTASGFRCRYWRPLSPRRAHGLYHPSV
jgi:hypothetical protein